MIKPIFISALLNQKHRLFLALGLILFLCFGISSELIFANNGLGFDGVFYTDITKNFFDLIKTKGINAYYFQRTGMPFLIHSVFKVFQISFTDNHIISAYQFINALFILISVYFYFKISQLIQLSKSIEIIGFSALFYCFPILKFAMYYPILMDVPAFSIAIVMLYYYLKNNPYMFFLLVFMGSFVYPNFIILSVLFIFKQPNVMENNEENKQSILKTITHTLSWVVLPLFLCFIYIFLFWKNSYELISSEFKINLWNTIYIWGAFILALVYILWLNYFPSRNFILKNIVKSINYKSIILLVIVILLTKFIIMHFSSKEKVTLTVEQYLYYVIYQAVKNPLNFIAAHVFYFGLIPLVSIFIIKDLKQEIQNFGLGMILFFSAFAFFSVGSESRQLINYYPFLVLLVLVTLNKKWNVSVTFSVVFIVVSISLSHFWYHINNGLSNETIFTDYFKMFEFPLQHYFMFQGPWTSDYMYKIHLAICAILILLLFVVFKKNAWITRKTI